MQGPQYILLCLLHLITALTDEEKKTIVEKHNFYRARPDPPAADMKALQWDRTLEDLASSYATKCIWEHNEERGFRGENLFIMSGSSLDVELGLADWHRERDYYNFTTSTCEEGQMCGHYTQMMWAHTERVGCGENFCEKLVGFDEPNMFLLVCNYEPPGNFQGEKPYTPGALCSSCPSSHICRESLCADEGLEQEEAGSTLSELPSDTTPSQLDQEPMQPELDLEATQPELDLQPTQPELDLQPMQPELDLQPTQPELDLETTQPELDPKTTQPELDLQPTPPELDPKTQPELDLEPTPPELDPKTTQPELDLEPTQPELDLETTQPELDLETTQPELDPKTTPPELDPKTQPELDLEPTLPELDLEPTQPELDIEPTPPELDPKTTQPELGPEPTPPELDPKTTQPELDIEPPPELNPKTTQPELDIEPTPPELVPEPTPTDLDPKNTKSEQDLEPTPPELDPKTAKSELVPEPTQSQLDLEFTQAEVDPDSTKSEMDPKPAQTESELELTPSETVLDSISPWASTEPLEISTAQRLEKSSPDVIEETSVQPTSHVIALPDHKFLSISVKPSLPATTTSHADKAAIDKAFSNDEPDAPTEEEAIIPVTVKVIPTQPAKTHDKPQEKVVHTVTNQDQARRKDQQSPKTPPEKKKQQKNMNMTSNKWKNQLSSSMRWDYKSGPAVQTYFGRPVHGPYLARAPRPCLYPCLRSKSQLVFPLYRTNHISPLGGYDEQSQKISKPVVKPGSKQLWSWLGYKRGIYSLYLPQGQQH